MSIKIEIAGSYTDKDIRRAQRDLERLGGVARSAQTSWSDSFQNMGRSVTGFGQTLTAGVTLPLVGLGALAVTFASDLEEATNKVNVVFGGAADAVKAFADDAATALGFSEAKALAAAGTYGNLFRAMGIGEQVSADMSTALVQLAADLASFNNANPEEVFDALRAGLSGETEPLRRFGININQARLEAEALNMGLVQQGQDMDAAAKAQAAYSLIMQDTALAQGDFARTADGTANRMRSLRGQFEQIGAELGTVMLPVVEQLAAALSDAADMFSGLDDTTKQNIVRFLAVAAAIGPIVMIVGNLITSVGAVSGALAGLGAAVSGPVLVVVAVIAALVGAVMLAWQRSEGFRDAVTNAWEDISKIVMQTWNDTIKPAVDELVAAFENHVMPAVDNLAAKFQEAWPGIRDALASFWGYAQPVLSFLVSIIANVLIPALSFLLSTAVTVWTGMATTISGAWTNIFQPVFSAIGGFITNQLVPAFEWLSKTVAFVWQQIGTHVAVARDVLSNIFEQIKGAISAVATWFSDRATDIRTTFSDIGGGISAPFIAAFNTIANAWNSTIGALEFTFPSWAGPLANKTISVPDLPTFNKGGMVPGVPGDPQLAVVHAGEMILRQSQIDEYRSRQPAPQARGDVNVYVNKSDASPFDIGRELLWTLKVAG